jgi:hypothetical protein
MLAVTAIPIPTNAPAETQVARSRRRLSSSSSRSEPVSPARPSLNLQADSVGVKGNRGEVSDLGVAVKTGAQAHWRTWMSTQITININETGGAAATTTTTTTDSSSRDSTDAFPSAGVDVFLSHFVIALQVQGQPQIISLSLPSAIQTVSRSRPFVYTAEKAGKHVAEIEMPRGATLATQIHEKDFQVRPKGFFTPGKESVWLKILNIDARANTEIGPVRIILGETLKREYSDLYQPSLGVAEALSSHGFPARLFFSPVAIIETSFGVFRTGAKALVGTKISAFPPVGSSPILESAVELHTIEVIREAQKTGAALQAPAAQILALGHPIDAALSLDDPGSAFAAIEASASKRS